jgi:3-oxoadipate enol-lactonase
MAFAEVNGTTIHYRFDGPESGEVVMLSNSLASNLAMWKHQTPFLSTAGYRVLRYDSRGHGRSAVAPGPYTLSMLTLDAVGLMDDLRLEQVHFCGISMGGMIGQMLGAGYGHRLQSLILCDTTSHMPLPEIWDERIETVRNNGMASAVDATIDRWFTKAGQNRMPEEIEETRRMILETPVAGYCGSCAAIRELDLREAIRAISTPTLIVVGEQDPGTPVAAAEFIQERIAQSTLEIIPDAAHFANVEQSAIFNVLIQKFLHCHSSALRK